MQRIYPAKTAVQLALEEEEKESQSPMVLLKDVQIKNVSMLWELMIRAGWVLPKRTSRYVTHRQLLAVRDHQIFGVK